MKLAIHHRPGSFSDQWIAYCKKKKIRYKIVNAFDNDIVEQLNNCDTLMWHHHHGIYKDMLAAKKILFSLEHAGFKTFPDSKTSWHFDDKVAQKYLLEAMGAPTVPSHVFYDKEGAFIWAKNTSYPKVFKLKGGAGAANVRLVHSETEARKLIKKAFGKGFPQHDRFSSLKERIRRFREKKSSFAHVIKGFGRLLIPTDFSKNQPNEKGYIYFQNFIPNNSYDTRVVVIGGEKAAAEKRYVRKGDFRASGSDEYSYHDIDINIIASAFNISKKLKLQSAAFDFVLDERGKPLIIELSYGFGEKGIVGTPGYWDSNLNWHKEIFSPHKWIIENLKSDN